ncbi:hypothetical protein, partial [Pseudomonas aeruginosa]
RDQQIASLGGAAGDASGETVLQALVLREQFRQQYLPLRIPLMADSDSIPIADSVPGDGGHVARVS